MILERMNKDVIDWLKDFPCSRTAYIGEQHCSFRALWKSGRSTLGRAHCSLRKRPKASRKSQLHSLQHVACKCFTGRKVPIKAREAHLRQRDANHQVIQERDD